MSSPPASFFIIGLCVMWVLMCGRMWWAVGRRHAWQRHAIAVAAGLGAALFYILGNQVAAALKPRQEPLRDSGAESVHVSPRAAKPAAP